MQTTSRILMIRPASFRMNEETAVDNLYQKEISGMSNEDVLLRAQSEFDKMYTLLQSHGIEVLIQNDIRENDTPDALFPNNWVSFHENGAVVLYPMKTKNRRRERREEILKHLKNIEKCALGETIDLSHYENENQILEGTGSLVLDRENRIAYASLSERTNREMVELWCNKMNYEAHCFHSYQNVQGKEVPIYHTNVMMSIGSELALVCLDSIRDNEERNLLEEKILNTGKGLIYLSEEECNGFAGNALEVKNRNGKAFLIMSTQAFNSLSFEKIRLIADKLPILHSPLNTIETLGGGSARCMMAEVFLPKQKSK